MIEDFGHRLALDRIRGGELIELRADPAECSAIADRLGLVAVERLAAHATLEREGGRIRATGRIAAALTQSCVVSNEPVPAMIDEPFDMLFVPEPQPTAPEEEIELGESDLDVTFYEGGAIDLGTAIADTLALSLDPYPRSAGAAAVLKEAGVLSEEQPGPFAALAQLRQQMRGDGS